MRHTISIPELNGPLLIPYLFQWPGYSEEDTYMAIVPRDMDIIRGDTFFKGVGNDLKIYKILDRRPAKGDWSKQPMHTRPDYIKFLAK